MVALIMETASLRPCGTAKQAVSCRDEMKREDIIRDIHSLEMEMATLEQQYSLLSEDFYYFFRAGELENLLLATCKS